MYVQQGIPSSISRTTDRGMRCVSQPIPGCTNNGASVFKKLVVSVMAVVGASIQVLAISLPVPLGTFPTAINKRGEVTGYCIDSIAVAHGFIRDARGRITVFDAPGAGPLQRQGTLATDINNDGTIVGFYIDNKLLHHGFVRDPNGALTKLDAPGAGAGLGPPVMGHPELLSGQGTLATSVNDEGTISGYFIDAKDVRHGFLRDKLGTFLVFDAPGGGDTVPESINDSGEVAGTYDDPPTIVNNIHFRSYSSGAVHGFLRDANGKVTLCDLPPGDNAPWEGPHPQTVSDDGAVVGWYGRNRDVFIRDAHGAYTTFSIPEPPISPVGSIGQEEITACYVGAKGATRGLRPSENGTPTTFNARSLGPGRFQGVICATLTAGGPVVGYYADGKRTNRAFVRDEHGSTTMFEAPCEDNLIVIRSVSPLIAGATEAMIIKGRHFGNYHSAADPHEGHISIEDSGPGRGCGEIPTPSHEGGGPLRVVRWTDAEIVVTGFGRPSKAPCPFHAGDHVGIGVWNAQTGAGPATYELNVGSTSKDLTPPRITSVTPVYPRADQTFTIKGQGFGTQPTDQDSDYLDISNDTVSWIARRATATQGELAFPTPGGFQPITLQVGRWTPNEIEVTGFGGAYGRDHWALNGGDQIKIEVWNPQTGAGPATYALTVDGAGQNLVTPRITSVTPVTPQAEQTIIIKGQGFGTHPPSTNQTTPYLEIADKTARWVAGRVGPHNAYSVMLSVSRWTDTEIEVTRFGGAYGTRNPTLNAGDQIMVKVWNAQTGAGPAVMTEEISRSSNGKHAGPSPDAPGQGLTSVSIIVPGNQPWTATGINLKQGELFSVTASGGVAFSAVVHLKARAAIRRTV